MGSLEEVVPGAVPETIAVLHVDDEPGFADLVATYLERTDEALTVRTAASASEGLELIDEAGSAFDCVVSDHDMPGLNGVEFLRRVRGRDPRLPFLLYTGKGSEEVASEAISAGVTDYLQKETGTEQYRVLANRIRNAVQRYRVESHLHKGFNALASSREPLGIVDVDGTYLFVNRAYAAVYGMEPCDLVGESWTELYPEEEVARFRESVLPRLESEGTWRGEATALGPDGPIEERLKLSNVGEGAHVCIVTDVES